MQMTGSSLAPAFYVIGTSIAGFIAVVVLKESARRPLPGAMPSVQTEQEAIELVEGQDDNPDLDLDELFPERVEQAADAAGDVDGAEPAEPEKV